MSKFFLAGSEFSNVKEHTFLYSCGGFFPPGKPAGTVGEMLELGERGMQDGATGETGGHNNGIQ